MASSDAYSFVDLRDAAVRLLLGLGLIGWGLVRAVERGGWGRVAGCLLVLGGLMVFVSWRARNQAHRLAELPWATTRWGITARLLLIYTGPAVLCGAALWALGVWLVP